MKAMPRAALALLSLAIGCSGDAAAPAPSSRRLIGPLSSGMSAEAAREALGQGATWTETYRGGGECGIQEVWYETRLEHLGVQGLAELHVYGDLGLGTIGFAPEDDAAYQAALSRAGIELMPPTGRAPSTGIAMARFHAGNYTISDGAIQAEITRRIEACH